MQKYTQKRCVHLDFHTSPDIPNIGKNFSKEKLQNALKTGNIESITVFAKCHHGLCYFPTKVGKMHPNLDFDLLGEMLDACHEIGVKAPIYITAGWSDYDATEHPEWIAVNDDGTYRTTFDTNKYPDAARPECAWKTMCLHDGEYCELIYRLTEEICDRYKDIDGLFYDILEAGKTDCHCSACKEGMLRLGLDNNNYDDCITYHKIKICDFQRKCTEILYKKHPDASIFFNAGGANPSSTYNHEFQTHYEMEDLPTVWGGYDKLPLRARSFASHGKSIIGMTGKFHLAWGEFGGFKPKEALKYEALIMAMYGVGISVGDHLHPDGEPDTETYKNIGYAFDYFKKLEPYCFNGEQASDIGLFTGFDNEANEGISKLLCEAQLDFKVVNNGDFNGCRLLIFPCKCSISNEIINKLNAFIKNGGSVLFMYDALIENDTFLIDVGAKYIKNSKFDVDYIKNVSVSFEADLPESPMLCQYAGMHIKAIDCEVLAEAQYPYFNRTYAHFCGHKNTPNDKKGEINPAIVKKGSVVYLANPISKIYYKYGAVFQKRYLLGAINSVYNKPIFKIRDENGAMLSKCRATMNRQEGRCCLNIAYASPEKSGCAEIIEDITILHNIQIELNIPYSIKRIYTAISNEELSFTKQNEGVCLTLPKLNMHECIVIETV